jgi:hypothetical protein
MATLVGSAVDQTAAPLAGVHVTLGGVAVSRADTGEAGAFAFPDRPEGDYTIAVELSGFEGPLVRCARGLSASCRVWRGQESVPALSVPADLFVHAHHNVAHSPARSMRAHRAAECDML